jgi:hypothetical protein
MPPLVFHLIPEGVSTMKKVFLVAALALGVSLMTSGKASAQSYEHIGPVIGMGYLGENPFTSMGRGHRAVFAGLFAETSLVSMAAGSMAARADMHLDSMNFTMSMYGTSMGAPINLKPIDLGARPNALQGEFALLNRRTTLDLGGLSASGSSRTWTGLGLSELSKLGTDASLAGMSGF